MTTNINLVKEFHKAFGHPVCEGAKLIDHDRGMFRVALIQEELNELKEAILADDLVEVADALADLTYVVCGAALEYGVPLNECVSEVHRSNMSKAGADGKPIYREDGKILKGPNYSEPDLKPILGV